jgi:hypothetical protein
MAHKARHKERVPSSCASLNLTQACSTPSATPTPYSRASTLLPAAAGDDDDDTGGGVLDEDDEANATTATKEARRRRRKARLWEEFVLRREGMQTRPASNHTKRL